MDYLLRQRRHRDNEMIEERIERVLANAERQCQRREAETNEGRNERSTHSVSVDV